MKKEEKLVKDYLSNPNICPFCKSEDITAGHGDFDYDFGTRDVQCNACDKTWTEEFKLTWVTFDPDDLK